MNKTLIVFARIVFSLIVLFLLPSCKKEAKPLIFKYEPAEPKAFAYLPRDKYGVIDWVRAMDEGIIKPKGSLDMYAKPGGVIDLNVYFESKGGMPGVMYPHRQHTMWLDCTNCHPAIFKMQRGANPITMLKIVEGEFCGRCHGVVAFPLSNCLRCHSQPAKGPNKLEINSIQKSIDKIKNVVTEKEKDDISK